MLNGEGHVGEDQDIASTVPGAVDGDWSGAVSGVVSLGVGKFVHQAYDLDNDTLTI